MKPCRINRYLAMCGLGSRRACEQLIVDKRVALNGQRLEDFSTQVDPHTDKVTVDGKLLKPVFHDEYWLLNKPRGYICTNDPQKAPKRAIDLVQSKQRLFTVGRLDVATEGLILLTSDGQLAQRIAHPRFALAKVYLATLDRELKACDLKRMRKGQIKLSDGPIGPIASTILKDQIVRLSLCEGRNRIVRRIFESMSYSVLGLKRVAIGPLKLGSLPVGQARQLSEGEIQKFL